MSRLKCVESQLLDTGVAVNELQPGGALSPQIFFIKGPDFVSKCRFKGDHLPTSPDNTDQAYFQARFNAESRAARQQGLGEPGSTPW